MTKEIKQNMYLVCGVSMWGHLDIRAAFVTAEAAGAYIDGDEEFLILQKRTVTIKGGASNG
jgi:hypothetical protein